MNTAAIDEQREEVQARQQRISAARRAIEERQGELGAAFQYLIANPDDPAALRAAVEEEQERQALEGITERLASEVKGLSMRSKHLIQQRGQARQQARQRQENQQAHRRREEVDGFEKRMRQRFKDEHGRAPSASELIEFVELGAMAGEITPPDGFDIREELAE